MTQTVGIAHRPKKRTPVLAPLLRCIVHSHSVPVIIVPIPGPIGPTGNPTQPSRPTRGLSGQHLGHQSRRRWSDPTNAAASGTSSSIRIRIRSRAARTATLSSTAPAIASTTTPTPTPMPRRVIPPARAPARRTARAMSCRRGGKPRPATPRAEPGPGMGLFCKATAATAATCHTAAAAAAAASTGGRCCAIREGNSTAEGCRRDVTL